MSELVPGRRQVTRRTGPPGKVGPDGEGVFRGVGKSNKPGLRALHPESVNDLVQQAIARAGIDPTPCSAHSLRAGVVTYAHLRGASDRAIAHQTRHRSLATVGTYVRIHQAWTINAATALGFWRRSYRPPCRRLMRPEQRRVPGSDLGRRGPRAVVTVADVIAGGRPLEYNTVVSEGEREKDLSPGLSIVR